MPFTFTHWVAVGAAYRELMERHGVPLSFRGKYKCVFRAWAGALQLKLYCAISAGSFICRATTGPSLRGRQTLHGRR
jgi:hypothetical protein